MNVRLTATQTIVLNTAAARPDGNIEPLQPNLHGGALYMRSGYFCPNVSRVHTGRGFYAHKFGQ